MNSNLTTAGIITFLIYILCTLGIGIWSSRKGRSTKRDYFLAGDKLPWWMIGGSIMAANISSHQIVGVMGVAYSRGVVAIVIEWGAILIGFNALLWIFLPFYIRNGFYTVPEYLQKRFGDSAKAAYLVLVLITYVFVEIGAVLYLGALSLHSLLDVPILTSVILIAVLTGVYTILGGLRAVVWTEMLQLCILVLGMISLTFVTINSAGGVASIFETSKDWKLFLPASDPDFPWTMYLGGLLCISVFYNATNQFIVQRALAAKNEWHARMGVIFGNYLKFVLPILIIAPALVAAKLFPGLDKPDLVFPVLVKELLPASLVGIVMAALVSAVMSHISGAINSSTTIITMDIYLPYIRKNASESESVRFGRIAGILVIVLGVLSTILLIRFSDKPIFLHLLNAYGLFTPGVATMFLMGILWKRTTNAGAMTAAVLSVPLSFIIEAWFPGMSFLNRTGIVFWVCVVICGFVSVCTKPKPTQELEGLIWDRKSVSLPVELSRYNRGVRNPMIWWALITLIILFFYIKYA
mgnify:CR=1 FL=1